VNTVINLRVSW